SLFKKANLIVKVFYFLGLVGVGFVFMYAAADPFYLKALQDGKTCCEKKEYEQAINLLKIAEFGLLEEKKYLPELYLYYALSYYKLGKITECGGIINTLRTELNIKDPRSITGPPQVENDLKIMLSVLEQYNNPANKGRLKELALLDRFESEFLKARDLLKNGNLPGADEKIKELRAINKKDDRLLFLQGMSAFNKKKYGKCIGYLSKITNSIEPVYKDEVFYYLSLSYFFEKDSQKADSYYRIIQDKSIQESVYHIIQNRRNP
ncbi:MAG: hypothetical protein MUF15_20820, partial [Acidobacteria bacterium]|nr:hypothetical protein [Acidobacteriota bacterium]